MKFFKTFMNYFFNGLGFGSVTYLIVLMTRFEPVAATSKNIASVLIMSGLIGTLSALFDWESLSFLQALVSHFCITLLLVIGMVSYNGWLFYVWYKAAFWLGFVLIYICIWVVIEFKLMLKVNQINRVLKERKQKN